MNGQSQGRSSSFSGKKLFALTAVALMVVSCLVALAVVDEVKAADSEVITVNETITLDMDKKELKLPKALEGKVAFDGVDTLTLTDLNIKYAPDSNKANGFIEITGNTEMEPGKSVNIKVTGTNSITSCIDGIYCDNFLLKFFGADTYSSLKIVVGADTPLDRASAIYAGTGLSIYNIELDVSLAGKIGKNGSDCICSMGPTTTRNSTVNASYIGSDAVRFNGIFSSGKLIIESGSNVTINANKVTKIYIGINCSHISVIDSELTVNPNIAPESPGRDYQSIGILTYTGLQNIFKNSNAVVYGLTNALCTNDGESRTLSDWTTDKLEGKISVSDVIPPEFTVLPPTEKTIKNTYKVVKIESPKSKVVFDLNGGDGNFPTKEYAVGETVNIPSTVPTKEGFEFKGWKSTDGKTYQAGERFIIGASDVTLTAQWESSPGPVPPLPQPSGDNGGSIVIAVIAFLAIIAVICVAFSPRKQ